VTGIVLEEGARRLAAPFRVLVLLTEALSFRPDEVQQALREDFPEMGWPAMGQASGRISRGSEAACLVDCGPPIGCARLRATPAPPFDWDDLLDRNRIAAGSVGARRLRAAVAAIEIAVPSAGPALPDRLEAARRATALAAVLSDLPVSAGAVQLWSDRVLLPAQAREAAEGAADGDVPLLDWTLPLLFDHGPGDREAGLVSGTTVGLSAILGYEIETRQTADPPPLAVAMLLSVAQDVVAGRVVPSDGLDLHPFDLSERPHRFRFVPEGLLGNDTGRWCLVPPDSPFPEAMLLGRPPAERGWMAALGRGASVMRGRWRGAVPRLPLARRADQA
jgi:hypothetical protein